MLWSLIHIVDILLWLFMAASVFYVAFFAACSLKPGRKGKAKDESGLLPEAQFLVLYPAYKEDAVILHSVESFLLQDHPREKYQLVVISDHMQKETNDQLSSLPITLLQPSFENSSKAKALQYAIEQTKGLSDFTHVVILDADNVVGSDFLTQLHRVCRQGYQAIQCHRTAKNADNDIAALDGISEEINNTLFRRAHNNIGLSSALIGSGMCFNYKWFSRNVQHLCSAVEDRELESLLAKQNIFVKYEEHIYVMDEKVSSGDNFQRQRMRWMTGQVQSLLQMLPYIPKAILSGNINYIDKTFQQALIPRSILLVLLPVLSTIITIISFSWSAKWWCLLILFCISLFIAIPRQLRTRSIVGRITAFSTLAWNMIENLVHIDKNNHDFLHTSHNK